MSENTVRAVVVGCALVVGVLGAWLLGGLAGPRSPAAGPYRRILCMSPAAAEIAFAVGAGDRIVGVSEYTDYPPDAADLPRCGGYTNPNFELIIGLQPDLIVLQGRFERLRQFARQNGIAVISLQLYDLQSILEETERLGAAIGLADGGREASAEMRRRLDAVRERVKGLPRPRVMLVAGRERDSLRDISVPGPGGFLSDLLRVAGGENVFEDLTTRYATVNKEALVARAPEIIIELHGTEGDDEQATAQARRLWVELSLLPAVRDGRVHAIAAGYALKPGPRVVRLAERLADVIHGEAEP